MKVFLAAYSLRMSFWVVPRRSDLGIPLDSATTMYIESIVEAVELIVMLVDTFSMGMPVVSVSMFLRELMATPTFPTSPSDLSLSESNPS